MKLRHLRYFLAIGEELHFGRAARRLNIAQPALSRQILALEEELKTQLLDRTSRPVRLTPAGEIYLEEARAILDHVAAAGTRARAAGNRERDMVRIAHAHLTSGAHDAFSHVLAQVRKSSHLVFDVQLMSTAEQLSAILAGRIDAGFGYLAGAAPIGLKTRRVQRDALCAARVRAENPLIHRCILSMSDLRTEPVLMFRRDRNPDLHDLILRELRQSGAEGPVIERADHGAWNWGLIEGVAGWQLVRRSELQAPHPPAGTCCLPLADFELPFGLDLIWPARNEAQALQIFLSLC